MDIDDNNADYYNVTVNFIMKRMPLSSNLVD